MNSVPRYAFVVSDLPPLGQVVPVDNGELCKYADHVASVERAEQAVGSIFAAGLIRLPAYQQGAADEREACAVLIDTMLAGDDGDEMSSDARNWAEDIAERIRTRGHS